tara:strand:- start:39 stop:542 length:504 start_codon:yes stop_codon:yes gene_type:complete
MIKNKLLFFFVLFFSFGCSDLQFVYNTADDVKIFNGKTKISARGEDIDVISNYLIKKFNNVSGDPVYLVSVFSKKNVRTLVVDKDKTASKYEIGHEVNYDVENLENSCLIMRKTISTKTTYDSKSAGYSFGTDISAKEESINNLESNLNQFMSSLLSSKNISCKNAN